MGNQSLMTHASHNATIDEGFVGSVTVEPGETSRLVVGIFEDGIPEPALDLEVEPNCPVSSEVEREHDRGEYHLIYRFRSLQNIPCQITVRQQAAA